MNLVVHQSIVIHNLKVGDLANSSVFQIGSAGMIKSLSSLYNTGGFTGPAPEAKPASGTGTFSELGLGKPFVPLPSPS
jgi:spore germination protein PB